MGVSKSALKSFGLVLSLTYVLASCGGSDPVPQVADQAEVDDSLIQTYLLENSIDAIKHESGFYYSALVENPTGDIQQVSGSILSIYYSVRVLNGQVIDEVLASQGEDPYKLKQGVNSIVPVGLDTGLGLMKEGETFSFIIPSGLAYGELSFSTLIPANSIIQVDAELVAIENEVDQLANETVLINDYINDKELNDLVKNPLDAVQLLANGVYHKRIVAGDAGSLPVSGTPISVTYTATFLDDIVFDRTNGNETFDFAFDNNIVINGLDMGLSVMESNESALLIIPSALAYGPSVGVVPPLVRDNLVELQVIPEYAAKVAPYQVLVFDLTLL